MMSGPAHTESRMFDAIESLPPDPILGVNAAFRRDESPHKIDLGIGVYRDQAGNTPVPAAVHEAERAMIAAQTTKTYIGPLGNPEFNERITELALGPLARTLRPRTAAIQTVGGCGALRVGAELLHGSAPETVIHVSTPTWANHEPLVGSSGLALERYPYYDPATRGVDFDRMHSHLARLPAGAVVLLHACCHNPTGADLSADQWRNIAELVEKRGLLPFVDLAYQGLGTDLEVDVAGPRLIAERVPEMLLAISCSKNFGLYRERVGALVMLARDARGAGALATHQARTARRMYSMPPDHGAAVVARVLGDAAAAGKLGGGAWRDDGAAQQPARAAGQEPRRLPAGPRFFLARAPSRHVLAAAPARSRTHGASRASPHLCAHGRPGQRRGDQRRQCRAGSGRDWHAHCLSPRLGRRAD